MKLKRSNLVQRLKAPYKEGGLGRKLGAAFAFGGGLVNGGLSPEAMELLGPIFRFDYMGASEFEHGAVPKAIASLVSMINPDDPFESKTIEVYPSDVVDQPFYGKHTERRTEPLEIHVLYVRSQLGEAAERVRELAVQETIQDPMERTGLNKRVVCVDGNDGDDPITGWLDLDNGWFATTSDEMRDGLLKLLGTE